MANSEFVDIREIDQFLEINPTEALTTHQRQTCQAAGNLMFGLDLPWQERAPFQKLLGLRYLQTQRRTPASAQFLAIPEELTDFHTWNIATQRSRNDLFTHVAMNNIEGQRCIDRFTHNLAYQIRDENTRYLATEAEKAQYLGFRLLYSPHRPDSSTAILKQALSVYLDNSLRTQKPDDLRVELGFSVEDINSGFIKCSGQEEAIIASISNIPIPPQWVKASDRLNSLAQIITDRDSFHSTAQIRRNGKLLPRKTKAESGGNLKHVFAAYEPLAILDSLLYPQHSTKLDAEAGYAPDREKVPEYREWAETILVDIICSEVIPATSVDQLKKREIFASLLETLFRYPEELVNLEQQPPLSIEIRYEQVIRRDLLRYAELVGEEEALRNIHKAAEVAHILDQNYNDSKQRTIKEWGQDRFLNPLAELVTFINHTEDIINSDRTNYFNRNLLDYFDRKTVQEAVKEAIQPRISFVFIDQEKRKILVAQHKDMGIWTLPTEGLIGETINETYQTGISQWLRKEKHKFLHMFTLGLDKNASPNSRFRKAQHFTAVISASSSEDGTHHISRGKNRITQAKWIELDTFPIFADWVPESQHAGYSPEATKLRQRRYISIFDELGKVRALNLPNPYLLPPLYFLTDQERIKFSIETTYSASNSQVIFSDVERECYQKDLNEGFLPTLVISARRPAEEGGTYFLLELDTDSGLLKPPEYPLIDTSANQLQSKLLSSISSLTVYPDAYVTKIGRIDSGRQNKGRAYYAVSPVISDNEPLPPGILLIDNVEKEDQLVKDAVDFVSLTKERRESTQRDIKKLFLVKSDTAFQIIRAQLARIQAGIIETGKIGEHDPRYIRNLISLYREIFNLHES